MPTPAMLYNESMSVEKPNTVFLAILFLLVVLSGAATFYRYIIKSDFIYFSTEESIPDRFAPDSYQQL